MMDKSKRPAAFLIPFLRPQPFIAGHFKHEKAIVDASVADSKTLKFMGQMVSVTGLAERA